MAESTTSKPNTPVIENPEQASSNFYWTRETPAGAFNLQTTIRGILNPEQIKAHIDSTVETMAYVMGLGGLAKQIGKSSYNETPASPMPASAMPTTVITTAPAGVAETVVQSVPVSQPAPASQPEPQAPNSFISEKLAVTISNNKKYFKVKGGPWVRYGVTVWDEVLVKAGINVGLLEAKEYDFKGYKATYVLKADGKPDKIISLEKVA